MYDVIVIGAGPAGCTAAKALAEKGYEVLLVEKFKMPRYKSCSGVLIKKSMELVKKYFGEATYSDSRRILLTFNPISPILFSKQGNYSVVEKAKPDPLNLLANTNVGS